MTAKKETELQSFMDNVNKKDKLNGKKVVFNFVKRKRKQTWKLDARPFHYFPVRITGDI